MGCRLAAVGVSLGLGGTQILESVDFSLDQGQAAVVLGPSGVGKSCLLRVLAGVLSPDRGEVQLRGNQGSLRGDQIRGHSAWMAQGDLLLPWLTVLDNALFPCGPRLQPREQLAVEARGLMARIGLQGYERYRPDQLSQGMRQRVALIRTVMAKKPFLLLDEPCSALDANSRAQVLELLAECCRSGGAGLLMISHHPEDARVLGAQTWQLERGRLWLR